MIDERFYRLKGPINLTDIAERVGARIEGNHTLSILAPAAAHLAGPQEICFSEGGEKTARSVTEQAAACLVSEKDEPFLPENVTRLIVSHPRIALHALSSDLVERRTLKGQTDAISAAAKIDSSACLGPGVVVGEDVDIGRNVVIGANTVIGPGVVIGAGTQIGNGVSIETALIGEGVVIQSNTTIGSTGFGVIPGPDGLVDNPHFGRVIIGDKVSLGANVCVDRGVFTDTQIGTGTKLDNLVQIAHNVVIGENSLMAAFGGISGSVEIGDGAVLGGRVGIADHVKIGKGARLAADAAVMRNVPAGETWGGTPAKPLQKALREWAWIAKTLRKRQNRTGA